MIRKLVKAGSETLRLATRGDSLRAAVYRTKYGASVELSDGRGSAFWAYAVSGSVVDVAVQWARSAGAVVVEVNA